MFQGSTIITINAKGEILSVDKNGCKIFGYDLEELVGNKINILIPQPYKAQHDTYLANYHNTGIPRIIGKSRMVEGQHKDGSIFPIRLSVSKIGEGEDMVFIGLVDKLEDKSASITINANGIIVSCNQNVEDLFGYKANELIGNNVNMLMSSPHKERHNSYIHNYRKGGIPKVIGKVRNVPARHKNGTVFPVSLQVEHIKMGNIELFRGKLEKVDTMEAVFSIDDSGVIVSCNHNFVLPLFGYTSTELIGKNISTLIPEIHQPSDSTTTAALAATNINDSGSPERDSKKLKTCGSNATEEVTIEKMGSGDQSIRSSSSCDVPSWKLPGTQRKELKHKDGSLFPVNLEIYPFQTADGGHLYSGRIKRVDIDSNGPANEDSSHKLIGDYYVQKTIGQGTYGKVKLAIHKSTKKEVAIKVLLKSRMKSTELERAKREIEIMKMLKHPNIAELYEVIDTDDAINIIMEFAGTTLLSYVMERGGLQELDAHKFFSQISSAISYCHKLSIVHRDIKHQNILLGAGEQIKIIDFGLSNFMEEGKLRSTFCGTPAYAAPEMILGKKYLGPEVDIWSMGVVLYSMLVGSFPFENVQDIIGGNYKDPKNVSEECCSLLRDMFQVDVKNRINLDQILNHPWVKNGPTASNIKVVECVVIGGDTNTTTPVPTPTTTTTTTTSTTTTTTTTTSNNNDEREELTRSSDLKRKSPS